MTGDGCDYCPPPPRDGGGNTSVVLSTFQEGALFGAHTLETSPASALGQAPALHTQSRRPRGARAWEVNSPRLSGRGDACTDELQHVPTAARDHRGQDQSPSGMA